MFQSLYNPNRTALTLNLNGTDDEFDAIYPRNLRRVSDRHFTPIAVAKKAASFLATHRGARILDVGSGAGKFCLVGAAATQGHFVGVEQREELVLLSNALAGELRIDNVRFVHSNIMSVPFSDFSAFYLFNPFFENVRSHERMDDSVLMNPSLFNSYTSYTRTQLSAMPDGTRVATYYTSPSLIPPGYERVDASADGHLLFWQKRNSYS